MALEGLASGFGMGPGVSPPLWPPKHCETHTTTGLFIVVCCFRSVIVDASNALLLNVFVGVECCCKSSAD